VHFATFVTQTPIAHLQRALDEVGRCGFDLCAVTMAPGRAGSEVRIEYRPCGTVSADTLVARIARFPEIGTVEGGPVELIVVAREAD
jgi:acetolactate synthase regulatory subunit